MTSVGNTSAVIENLFEQSTQSDFKFSDADKHIIHSVLNDLDQGKIRVCTKDHELGQAQWITHQWIKKAILLFFKMSGNQVIEQNQFSYFDKVPVKKWQGSEGVRVVPPAIARFGSYIESGAILMPSYVNIGAYVGSGTMVDTWATVGSCAQIGKYVHLSGGVGIGGVLEPAQAQPVIIEDDCFIGSRCIVVEGVHLETGVVLGAGVTLTASTKIFDVSQPPQNGEVITYKGRVPANCVVIPGIENKKFPAGEYGVPAALIIGQRKESTNKKTSLNQALRDFNVNV